MKTLLIIDPQYDFIDGTLPVPHASVAMARLADAVPSMDVDHIVITMDAHTIDHCSFVAQGGLWPAHCVKYSLGASIDKGLFDAIAQRVQAKGTPITYIEKATMQGKDEYSAFAESCPSCMTDAEVVYVSGIAGDVCVHTSVSDLLSLGLKDKLCVIEDVCPSLDGGEKLRQLIVDQGLCSKKIKDLEEKN